MACLIPVILFANITAVFVAVAGLVCTASRVVETRVEQAPVATEQLQLAANVAVATCVHAPCVPERNPGVAEKVCHLHTQGSQLLLLACAATHPLHLQHEHVVCLPARLLSNGWLPLLAVVWGAHGSNEDDVAKAEAALLLHALVPARPDVPAACCKVQHSPAQEPVVGLEVPRAITDVGEEHAVSNLQVINNARAVGVVGGP